MSIYGLPTRERSPTVNRIVAPCDGGRPHQLDGADAVEMREVCAWCKSEQSDVAIGPPLSLVDLRETHTICERHARELIAQLPSRSFPGIRTLVVVRRTEAALYRHLAAALSGVKDAAVIFDRRERERRREGQAVTAERRRVNRRIRKTEFGGFGYFIVHFGPRRGSR